MSIEEVPEPTITDLQTTMDDIESAYEYFVQTDDVGLVFRICFDDGSIVDMYPDSRGWDRATYANKLRTIFVEVNNCQFRTYPSGLGGIESRFSNGGTIFIDPKHVVDLCYVDWENSVC